MATSSTIVSDFDDEDVNFSDFEDFLSESGNLEDEGGSGPICVCGLPSTEQVIRCSKKTCKLTYFHAPCVGLTVTGDLHGEWFCEDCVHSNNFEAPPEPSQSHQSKTNAPADTQVDSTVVVSPSRPSTEKMKYPPKKFGKVDAAARAEHYAKTVLRGVFSAPLFTMDTPLTKQVKDLAQKLQSSLDNEGVVIFFKKLTGKLWKKVASVVRGKQWTEECVAQMWQEFHQLRYHKKLLKRWTELLNYLNIVRQTEEEAFLYQYLLQEIFKLLMQEMMEKDLPISTKTHEASTLDESEEQALRYCTGYVPKKLLKRYSAQKKSETAVSFVEVLRGWSGIDDTDEASTFMDYTSLWLQKQNRGGLFLVNDNVYSFFKEMEMIVRGSLRQENIGLFQNTDVQVTLFNCLLNSTKLTQLWEPIAGSLPNEAKRKLCEEVVKAFLKMRCEAFVRVYMMIRKEKDKSVSKRGEKGLRKELSK